MTNLSKELCEICGIGYIIKCKHGEQFPQNCDCNYSCEECSACKKIYPDFEAPENFIKLMELRVKGLSGGNLTLMGILNKEYWLSDRQGYIKFLCRYYIPDLTPYWQDKLKQAIRETEWVYG